MSLDDAICTRTAERRSAPRVRFQVLPEGYKPLYRRSSLRARQRHRHRHEAESSQSGTPRVRDAAGAHQNHHVRAPHARARGTHVSEAIWGHNIQTLNCVGYDHNWVKQYVYADDAAPLLPKGTIVHLIGFLDTTPANKNPADRETGRAAAGGRSPTCSSTSVIRCRSPRNSSRPRWPSGDRT